MRRVDVVFTFDTEDDADIVESALKPEVVDKLPRVNTSLLKKGKTLHLCIESSDTSSLRAACNSYLRWVQTIINVIDKV
ncbi:MAG: KEOPS complex subunit Pcc1 [Candidatus Thermoplasmatota archaeon]